MLTSLPNFSHLGWNFPRHISASGWDFLENLYVSVGHPFYITVTWPTVKILPKVNIKMLMENTWASSKFEQENWTEMEYYLPVLRPRGLIQNIMNSAGGFHMDQALIFNEWRSKEFHIMNTCQDAIHHHKSNVKLFQSQINERADGSVCSQVIALTVD